MKYDVRLTRSAENDLNEAADYIEFVLLNAQAADDLMNAAEETFTALAEFAARHPLLNDPVFRAWGIRFVRIRHYIAFYAIDEANQRVYIVRFLYEKRNWIGILKNGFTLE